MSVPFRRLQVERGVLLRVLPDTHQARRDGVVRLLGDALLFAVGNDLCRGAARAELRRRLHQVIEAIE